MIPVAILIFLVGAVLSWAFRVWILVPTTLLVMVMTAVFELWLGSGLLNALGYGLLIGLVPQSGYAFGLFAQNMLVLSRSPLAPRSSRDASVAKLYKQNSSHQTR